MKKNNIQKAFAIIAVAFLIFIFSACSIQKEKSTPLQDQTNQKIELEEEQKKKGVFIGDKAYDFILLDKEGNEIRLSDLKGKAIFLQFWTTWCRSCVHQIPVLQEIYETYSEQDVVLLIVNVLSAEKGKDKEAVNRFLEENGYALPIVFDIDGEVSAQYKVGGFPTTYMLDKSGKIVDFTTESMEKEEIVEMIENARK